MQKALWIFPLRLDFFHELLYILYMADQEAVVIFHTKNSGDQIRTVNLPPNHTWIKDETYKIINLGHYYRCIKCNTHILWSRYTHEWKLEIYNNKAFSNQIPNCNAKVMDIALE